MSGQIDVMCQGLREISMKRSDSSATRSLVERHQRIISLSDNIDRFFSFVALVQFVWNTIVICSIGFMIVMVSAYVINSLAASCKAEGGGRNYTRNIAASMAPSFWQRILLATSIA